MDLRLLTDAAPTILYCGLGLTLAAPAAYVLLAGAGRDAVRVGLASLLRHPLRTTLTLIGVITGVAAVVAVISVGDGTRVIVLDEVAATGGTGIIEIVRDEWRRQAGTTVTKRIRGRASRNRGKRLEYRDYENLNMMLTRATVVCAEDESRRGMLTQHGDRAKEAPMIGATAGYDRVYNWRVANGRLFSEQEVEHSAKVAVLGAGLAEDLFGGLDPVGGEIRARHSRGTRQGSLRLSVVGVMEARAAGSSTEAWNGRIILPLTTFHKRIEGDTEVVRIRARVAHADEVGDTLAEIRSVLARRHEDVDALHYWAATKELATAARLGATLKLVMGSVAAIALVVSGIGIMNIMLVSVAERVHEIGLRKAMGAKHRDLLFQFLIEASVLSLGGGVLGAAAGVGLGRLAARAVRHYIKTDAPWPSVVSPSSILVAVGAALLVGIVAGAYPASCAARLSPIDGLRSNH